MEPQVKRPKLESESVSALIGQKTNRKVRFADESHIIWIDAQEEYDENEEEEHQTEPSDKEQRTSELTILSTLHGRARRELRNLAKIDLQSAIKYGVRTRSNKDPITGLHRWKYEYGNVVYITDYTSTKEVTCYKQPIAITSATITEEMRVRNEEDARSLKEDPLLCTTHSVIVIDQSGSMRTCDVVGFRTRSDAAFGVLALEYISEQLHNRNEEDEGSVDAVTIITMNDYASRLVDREPLVGFYSTKC